MSIAISIAVDSIGRKRSDDGKKSYRQFNVVANQNGKNCRG